MKEGLVGKEYQLIPLHGHSALKWFPSSFHGTFGIWSPSPSWSLVTKVHWSFCHSTFTGWQSVPTTVDVCPLFVTDDELGVVKLRHTPSTSLESFRILHEYKRIAVMVHRIMYVGVESTHSFNACERLRCCRVYNDDDRKTPSYMRCRQTDL